MRVNIHGLIDNAKCYAMVRHLRWPEGVECPHCHATEVIKTGMTSPQPDRQHALAFRKGFLNTQNLDNYPFELVERQHVGGVGR